MANARRLSARPGPQQRGSYVLIAMPNANRAGAFRSAIASLELETVLVRDGDKAKEELARRGAPTLSIIDLSLPKIDGFELLRELRKQAQPSEAAVIVISGHPGVRVAAQRLADSLGIAKVLPFDVDRPALRDTVEKALAHMAVHPALDPIQPQERRVAPSSSAENAIEAAVIAAARRFRAAITLAYVKEGSRETMRGFFAISDAAGSVSLDNVLSFLREVAAGHEPLVVPDAANYAALEEMAPGGLHVIRGFAATPFRSRTPALIGALCVFDTKPLAMDATEFEAFEGLGRDLGSTLESPAEVPRESAQPATSSAGDTGGPERPRATDTSKRLAIPDSPASRIAPARRDRSSLSGKDADGDRPDERTFEARHQSADDILRDIGALLHRILRAYDDR